MTTKKKQATKSSQRKNKGQEHKRCSERGGAVPLRQSRIDDTVLRMLCSDTHWIEAIAIIAVDLAEQDDAEADLALALQRYTDPSDPIYDPDFTAELQRLRPDWFGGVP